MPLRVKNSLLAEGQANIFWRLFRSSAAQAFKAVKAFKLRSMFVILAVSLGITSLTVIVASLEGANNRIDEMVSMFGPDAAFVMGGNMYSRATGQRTKTLSWSDVRVMRDSLPGIYIAAPISQKGRVTIVYENKNFEVNSVQGSTEDYSKIWDWPLGLGRDITKAELDQGASVCLLGAEVTRELFGNSSPIGRTVQISRVPFEVVGVLSERGASGGGGNMDETVVIPLSTLVQRFNQDRQYFRMVRLRFIDAANMEAHTENVKSLLRYLHGLGPDDPDDFSLITSLDIQRFISMIKGGMGLFLGFTAVAALLVSGFVLANLFYLSVSERSVEVGLKKALGAPSQAITMQFLCESVILTLGGAILGLVWGLFISLFLENNLFKIEPSWLVFFSAFLAAIAVGIIFGLKPAHKAAAMEPIAALKGQ